MCKAFNIILPLLYSLSHFLPFFFITMDIYVKTYLHLRGSSSFLHVYSPTATTIIWHPIIRDGLLKNQKLIPSHPSKFYHDTWERNNPLDYSPRPLLENILVHFSSLVLHFLCLHVALYLGLHAMKMPHCTNPLFPTAPLALTPPPVYKVRHEASSLQNVHTHFF